MPTTIPAGLKPTIQGFAIGAPSGVEQLPVAGGASRFGLAWDGGRQPFQVRMVLDAELFSIWTIFFLHTIKRGGVPFDMPLDSGFGMVDHECRMVPGTYQAARDGVHTVVSFKVEALSGAYSLTAEEAEALIAAWNGYPSTDPPTIPRGFCPVIQGYSFDAPGGAVRGDVEGGVPGYASAWDRDVQRFSVTLILDAEKFEVWTAFLHHKISKGALAFTMPLDSGMGVEDHVVNIIPGTLSAPRNGRHWIVAFTVEAESTVYSLSDADAQAILDFYGGTGPGSAALLARIAKFANQDTLVLQ